MDEFRTGLTAIAQNPAATPGQLVLVAANAIMLRDTPLLDSVRSRLTGTIMPVAASPAGVNTAESEDTAVLKLIISAPDPFDLIRERTTPAGYVLQYNQLRAHRPHREAAAAATTLHRPYDANRFNFNRVVGESYHQATWQERPYRWYYNKYPIAPRHASLVPDPVAGHEQFLQATDHAFAWASYREVATSHPAAALAYNALGAYASVNHLHFQYIPDASRLPLVKQLLSGRSLEGYPVPGQLFTDPDEAWQHIAALQSANRPFNLIYTAGQIVIIERRFQGSYAQPDWTTGLAWFELSGGIITTDPVAFDRLSDNDITAALEAATNAT